MAKLAANLSTMFNELDFMNRFEAASRAGFKGVEFMFPYQYDKAELADALDRFGLTQVLINLPAGDWEAGDRGIACDPRRVEEFQEGVGQAIEYAAALGCRRINCLAGISPRKVDPAKVHDTFVGNLKFAANLLGQYNVSLLIEPVNIKDVPGFYLCYTVQARAIIEEVESDNLHLQYDVYHMQIMEGDLARSMKANKDIIRHIQIADNPGRNEPGTGEINYPFLIDALDRMGYEGWIGCEYVPQAATGAGLAWATPYLR